MDEWEDVYFDYYEDENREERLGEPMLTKNGKYIIEHYETGEIFWTLSGELHREDGPAVINDKVQAYGKDAYYLEDRMYTEKEWTVEMRKRKLKALGI